MALPDKKPGSYHVMGLAAEHVGDVECDDDESNISETFEREPTQVTRLLEDFEAAVGRSRETMENADKISARAQRLVRRKKGTPVRLLRAVRESAAPKSDG